MRHRSGISLFLLFLCILFLPLITRAQTQIDVKWEIPEVFVCDGDATSDVFMVNGGLTSTIIINDAEGSNCVPCSNFSVSNCDPGSGVDLCGQNDSNVESLPIDISLFSSVNVIVGIRGAVSEGKIECDEGCTSDDVALVIASTTLSGESRVLRSCAEGLVTENWTITPACGSVGGVLDELIIRVIGGTQAESETFTITITVIGNTTEPNSVPPIVTDPMFPSFQVCAGGREKISMPVFDCQGCTFRWTGPGIDGTNMNIQEPTVTIPDGAAGILEYSVIISKGLCDYRFFTAIERLSEIPQYDWIDTFCKEDEDPQSWIYDFYNEQGISAPGTLTGPGVIDGKNFIPELMSVGANLLRYTPNSGCAFVEIPIEIIPALLPIEYGTICLDVNSIMLPMDVSGIDGNWEIDGLKETLIQPSRLGIGSFGLTFITDFESSSIFCSSTQIIEISECDLVDKEIAICNSGLEPALNFNSIITTNGGDFNQGVTPQSTLAFTIDLDDLSAVNFNGADIGTYVFGFFNTDRSLVANITVEIIEIPAPNFDETYCFDINGSLPISNLPSDFLSGYTGIWQLNGSEETQLDPNSLALDIDHILKFIPAADQDVFCEIEFVVNIQQPAIPKTIEKSICPNGANTVLNFNEIIQLELMLPLSGNIVDFDMVGVDISDWSNVDFKDSQSGIYQFNYILTDGVCLPTIHTIMVTVNNNPGDGGSQLLCITNQTLSSFDLNSLLSSGETSGTWQVLGDFNTLPSSLDDLSNLLVGEKRDYIFYNSDGCDASYTVTIIDGGNAGMDNSDFICTFPGVSVAPYDLNMLLSSDADPGGSWTGPNGDIIIDPINLLLPTLLSGSEIYTYTVGSGDCQSVSTHELQYTANISAGPDVMASVCNTSSLNGVNVDIQQLFSITADLNNYWIDPIDNSILDVSLTQDLTSIAPGIKEYWFIADNGGLVCSMDTAIHRVEILSNALAGTVLNGVGGLICDNTRDVNLFDYLSGNSDQLGEWTVLVNGVVNTIENPTLFDFVGYEIGSEIFFEYSRTDVLNGKSCKDIATISFTIVAAPYSGTDISTALCSSDASSIDFINLLGNPVAGGVWQDLNSTGIDPTSNPSNVDLSNLDTGTYQWEYTVSGGFCGVTPAIIEVQIEADDLTVTFEITNGSADICADGACTEFTVNISGGSPRYLMTFLVDLPIGPALESNPVFTDQSSYVFEICARSNILLPDFSDNNRFEVPAAAAAFGRVDIILNTIMEDGASCATQVTGRERSLGVQANSDASFTFADHCDSDGTLPVAEEPGGQYTFAATPLDQAVIDRSSGAISNATCGNTYDVLYAIAGDCPVEEMRQVVVSCAPTFTVTSRVCASDLLSYSAVVTTNATMIIPSEGVATNNNNGTWTIDGISPGLDITVELINASTSTCTDTQMIDGLDCGCALVAAPVAPDAVVPYCVGAPVPDLKVSVGAGESVNWFDASSGGNLLLADNNTYTPSGPGIYFAEAFDIVSDCPSDVRTSIEVIEESNIAGMDATIGIFCMGTTELIDLESYRGMADSGIWSMLQDPTFVVTNPNELDISTLEVGSYSFIFTVDVISSCAVAQAMIDLTIEDLTDASFVFEDFCQNEIPVAVPTNPGGTYRFEPAVNDGATLNAMTGEINGGVCGTMYSIEYVTAGDCPDSSIEEVQINCLPNFIVINRSCQSDLVNAISVIQSDAANITVDVGAVTNNMDGTWSIMAPANAIVNVTLVNAANCIDMQMLNALDCSCPDIDPPVTSIDNYLLCLNDPLPELLANSIPGLIVDWYDAPTGGMILESGNSFMPSDPGVYYAESREESSGCTSTSRTSLAISVEPALDFLMISEVCDEIIDRYAITIQTDATMVTSLSGMVNQNIDNTYTISDIPAGELYSFTLFSDLGCETLYSFTAPNCGCPLIPPLVPFSTTEFLICSGDDFPFFEVVEDPAYDIVWVNELGDILETEASYQPSFAGNYFAYNQEVLGACTSERVQFSVDFASTPLFTNISPVQVCAEDAMAYDLTQLNTLINDLDQIIWYIDDPKNGGLPITNPQNFNLNGSSNIWILVIGNNNCSESAPIQFVISSSANSTFQYIDFCLNEPSVPLAEVDGGVYTFENNLMDGAMIDPLTGVISDPVCGTTYEVKYSIGTSGCLTETVVPVDIKCLPQFALESVSCSNDGSRYLVVFATDVGPIDPSSGTLTNLGGERYMIDDVDIDQVLNIRLISSGACSIIESIQPPNCTCPNLAAPIAMTSEIGVCVGEPFPMVTVDVADGLEVFWYESPVDGFSISSGVSYTPTDYGTYHAESVDPLTACTSSVRTAISFVPADNNAGIDNNSSLCSNVLSAIDLEALIGLHDDGVWELAEDPDFIIVDGSDVDLTSLVPDTYTFRHIVNGTSCEPDTALVSVLIANAPNAGEDITIDVCGGQMINLLDYIAGDSGGTFVDRTTGISLMQPQINTADLLNATLLLDYSFAATSVCPASGALWTINISEGDINSNVAEVFCDPTQQLVVNGVIYDINNPTGVEMITGGVCDTVVNVNLSYPEEARSTLTRDLCDDLSIQVGDQIFDASRPMGSAVLVGESQFGCDSIVVVDLNIIECVGSARFRQDDASCFGDSDGSIYLTLTNGVLPMSYIWSQLSGDINGSGTVNQLNQEIPIRNLPAGRYSFEVMDGNGMIAFSGEVEIIEPDELIASAIVIQDVGCDNNDLGILEATVQGGTANFDFLWSNNETTNQIENLMPGMYELMVIDANGCTAQASAQISEAADLEIAFTFEDPECANFQSGVISIDVPSGLPEPLLYSVDGVNFIDSPIVPELDAGDYDLMVQDGFGCLYPVGMVTLAYKNDLISTLSDTIFLVDGEQTFLKTGFNFDPIQVDWVPDLDLSCNDCANPIFMGTQSNRYTVIAEEDTGCKIETQVVVIVEEKLDNVFIPNVMSLDPSNSQEQNAHWMPEIRGDVNATISYTIFDRWGSKVVLKENLAPDNPDLPWDGLWNTDIVEPGVYIYNISIQFEGQSERQLFVGNLTVVW